MSTWALRLQLELCVNKGFRSSDRAPTNCAGCFARTFNLPQLGTRDIMNISKTSTRMLFWKCDLLFRLSNKISLHNIPPGTNAGEYTYLRKWLARQRKLSASRTVQNGVGIPADHLSACACFSCLSLNMIFRQQYLLQTVIIDVNMLWCKYGTTMSASWSWLVWAGAGALRLVVPMKPTFDTFVDLLGLESWKQLHTPLIFVGLDMLQVGCHHFDFLGRHWCRPWRFFSSVFLMVTKSILGFSADLRGRRSPKQFPMLLGFLDGFSYQRMAPFRLY